MNTINAIYNKGSFMIESVQGKQPLHLDNCTDDIHNMWSTENLRKGEIVYKLFPLTDYIDEWLSTYKKGSVKLATFDRLVTSRKALTCYAIASMPIGAITAKHIQEYVNELTERGYSKSTILKQKRIVTAPLKHAAALHHIDTDPTYGVKNPARTLIKKQSREIVAYTTAEQKALCNHLGTYEHPAYAVAALIMETGLRIGEALALCWDDVDILRTRLRVRSTVIRLANKKQSLVQGDAKSHTSNRTIPLTPKAIQILERLSQSKINEWVFNNTDNERLTYEAVRYQIKELCRKINIPYYGTHVFRHTFATNCYHRGMNVKILSNLLGHSDVNITYNTYIHLYGDGFDEMYEALVKGA